VKLNTPTVIVDICQILAVQALRKLTVRAALIATSYGDVEMLL
jgi:hypothetical protein